MTSELLSPPEGGNPQDIPHGTPTGYHQFHSCRCEYCAAAHRVSKRQGDQKALLASVRDAYLSGAPIPAAAEKGGAPRAGRAPRTDRRTAEHKANQSQEAQAAADGAHQARLRAVERANRNIAALAMLSVAELTEDPIRAMRYERLGLELANDG